MKIKEFRQRRPLAFLGVLLLLLLSLLYAFDLPPYQAAEPLPADLPEEILLRGEVRELAKGEESISCLLSDCMVEILGRQYKAGRVRVRFYEAMELAVGEQLFVCGQLQIFTKATNPGQFDYARYEWIKGVDFQMSNPTLIAKTEAELSLKGFLYGLRERFLARVDAAFPEDVSPLCATLLAGERRALPDEVQDLFITGGVMHLLAISGMHLSVLAGLLSLLLRRLHVPGKIASILSILLLFIYAAFAGFPVSAMRALLMFLLRESARHFLRSYDMPTALAFAEILLLLTNPRYLLHSGFQFSFAVMLVLSFAEKMNRFASACIIFFGTLPLVLWHNFELPLYNIGLNLLLIPLLPFLLLAAIAGLLGGAFAWPATVLFRGLLWLLRLVSDLPHARIVFGRPHLWQLALYLLCFSLLLFFYRHWHLQVRRFFLLPLFAGAIFILSPLPRKSLSVTMLDVGQGDGISIEDTACTFFVDGGSTSYEELGRYRLLPYLKCKGVRHVDAWFVSHYDLDHTSGIQEVLSDKAIYVERLVLPYRSEVPEAASALIACAKVAGTEVLTVRAGDVLTFGETSFTVLAPGVSFAESTEDENAQSMVLALAKKDFDMLFTGDLEETGEAAVLPLLQAYCAACDIEVLKVGHHGAKTSTGEDFLATVSPEIALISVGANNRYGHPSAEVLERLDKHGVTIYRTDECGAITSVLQ